MSTNETQDQGAAGVDVAGLLRGMNWPTVAALALIAGVLLGGPALGVDVDKVTSALVAIIAAGGLHYGRQAAKQTNGALDGRMNAAVERGTAAIRAELPDLIRQALDTPTEPRSPWLDAGDTPAAGEGPSWAPGTYSNGQ